MKNKRIEVSLDAKLLKKVLEIAPDEPEIFIEQAMLAHINRIGKLNATEKTLRTGTSP